MFVRTTFITVRKCVKVFTASQSPTEFLWPNNAALHGKKNICGRKKFLMVYVICFTHTS